MNWSQESVEKVAEALRQYDSGAMWSGAGRAQAALSVIAELPEVRGLVGLIRQSTFVLDNVIDESYADIIEKQIEQNRECLNRFGNPLPPPTPTK
jgi:hypothetical protein